MIALFLLKLSVGITLMWALMPRKDVTDGFFRIQMRLLLGLTVLAALSLTQEINAQQSVNSTIEADQTTAINAAAQTEFVTHHPKMTTDTLRQIRSLMIGVAVLSYFASIFWALGRRRPGNLCIHLLNIACVTAVVLHAWHIATDAGMTLQLLSDFSTAVVLGAVITGMLLGHWYLTTPSMSITPLWWFNYAILCAAVLRLCASTWTGVAFGFGQQDTTHTTWLVIRWVGGIGVPICLSAVVWRILKFRNTQSATGVLFAGLIMVFMGEMTAALLERDVQLPY